MTGMSPMQTGRGPARVEVGLGGWKGHPHPEAINSVPLADVHFRPDARCELAP